MPAVPEWLAGLDIDISLDEYDELEGYFSDSDPNHIDESKLPEHDPWSFFDRWIIVDNVPIAPTDKIPKLKAMLTKVFSTCGTLTPVSLVPGAEDGIYLPVDRAANTTVGFAFISFKNAREAEAAAAQRDGFQLDSRHAFRVNVYSDIPKLEALPAQYEAPAVPEYKEPPQLNDWLLDEQSREQFVLRYGLETEIHWSEGMAQGGSSLVYGGQREKNLGKVWCDNYVAFSPQGSYFVTMHKQGVATWGGSRFESVARFAHPNVKDVVFSPDEKRLLTSNGSTTVLWDVLSGKELRSFKGPNEFKFSGDGTYLARTVQDGISIFTAVDAKLVEKKPVKAKGVVSFEWSPSKGDHILAYWAPEDGNLPARVCLMDADKRADVRSKNLFNVRDVQLHWQDSGDFMCAQVLRHTKSGKTTFHNFEIFRMRDANFPNETMTIKDQVTHIAFEPKGFRFAVLHHEGQEALTINSKMDCTFYSLKSIQRGDSVDLLFTLGKRDVDTVHWSPAGDHCVLTAFKNNKPGIEFVDVTEQTTMGQGDHFTGRLVRWDPSGRLLVTAAVQNMFGDVSVKDTLENGYCVWTFQGELLRKEALSEFFQFEWRPRVVHGVELSEQEMNGIKKSLKEHMKRFEEEDELMRKRLELAQNVEKFRMLQEYRERRKRMLAERVEVEQAGSEEDEYEMVEEVEEVVVETTREVC